MNTFQERFHLFLQRRCLTPTVPAEVDRCYQAGVSGPTMNAQKKLSCQEAGAEGQGDFPDLNTEPILPWFPSLLGNQSFKSVWRHYHLVKETVTMTLCDPVFYSLSSSRITSVFGRRQELPYFSFLGVFFHQRREPGYPIPSGELCTFFTKILFS